MEPLAQEPGGLGNSCGLVPVPDTHLGRGFESASHTSTQHSLACPSLPSVMSILTAMTSTGRNFRSVLPSNHIVVEIRNLGTYSEPPGLAFSAESIR